MTAVLVPASEDEWLARFWAKVNKNGPVPVRRPELGPCWIWTGSINIRRGGYGQFRLHGRVRKAHQVSYELGVGPLPEGTEPDHLCKVHDCVNWHHLEAVTHRENYARGSHLSAIALRTGKCINGHRFSPQNTRIRRDGTKVCIECARDRTRRWRARGAAA